MDSGIHGPWMHAVGGVSSLDHFAHTLGGVAKFNGSVRICMR
jgi:hypothetical protein